MNPFPPIHTDADLAAARAVARRRMKSVCEVVTTGETSPGFGQPGTASLAGGRLSCSITIATKPGESTPGNDAVQSTTEYEFAFPLGTVLKPETRLAVPANFPKWQAETAYFFKSLVAPSNWVSGRTEIYECVRPGVSGAKEPDWNPKRLVGETLPGASLDTPAIWRLKGYATLYEVMGVNDKETNPTEVVLRVKELN